VEAAMRVADWAPARALSGMAFFRPSFLPSLVVYRECKGAFGKGKKKKKKKKN
jgi:hypothetical protein